jgi:hypothetical protein
MKIIFNKKFAGIFFIALLMLGSFSAPRRSEAQVATFDGSNFVQNTLTAINTTSSSLDSYYQRYKDTVLNRLATMAAKQLIRQITASVVNWINSGFEGSPSFLQNPGAFFLDVADQTTGEFLATTGGPLTALCSPFSLNIRLALSFKYHPQVQKRYACTLGKIIENSKGAVETSSINGFTAGDFKQGGWPAFVSLTTEPRNNVYGAYLTANSELSWRVANSQAQQRDELSNGKGFLSWRDPKCKAAVKKNNEALTSAANEDEYLDTVNANSSKLTDEDAVIDSYNQGTNATKIRSEADCPIQTPGSVIGGTLQNHLDGPLRELELVDNINQIVNALFAQLAVQVLQKGLGTVSSTGSGGTSYIDATVAEANMDNSADVQKARTDIIASVDNTMKNALTYQANRREALTIIFSGRDAYNTARACYQEKLTKVPPVSQYAINRSNDKIREIDEKINDNISSRVVTASALSTDADNRVLTLTEIKTRALAANTLSELNVPSQMLNNLLNSGSLTTAIDIQKSESDIGRITGEINQFKDEARQELEQCKIIY